MVVQQLQRFRTQLSTDPALLFNSALALLASTALAWKVGELTSHEKADRQQESSPPPIQLAQAQAHFLLVFWLMRLADWLQGPYFYEVYRSKVIDGQPVSLDLVVQLFLTGFVSTAVFGPWLGRLADSVGRRFGLLLFAALYAVSAASTRSQSLPILFLGRLASGLGTALLFSAPEAWVVSDFQRRGLGSGPWLGRTFYWAFAGDVVLAILAGPLAAWSATVCGGPWGPFQASIGVLALGAALMLGLWKENTALREEPPPTGSGEDAKRSSGAIGQALQTVLQDRRIILLGLVQALFEGAMYIFVLQWPPALSLALRGSSWSKAAVPFGTVFSCLMACCLLGATAYSKLQGHLRSRPGDNTSRLAAAFAWMLSGSVVAMAAATALVGSGSHGPVASFVSSPTLRVLLLSAAFFAFEGAVGMYFPAMGTLRSGLLPDAHRSVIMNLFGVPLNLLVVSVFLSIGRLGMQGALGVATAALICAWGCMLLLSRNLAQPLARWQRAGKPAREQG